MASNQSLLDLLFLLTDLKSYYVFHLQLCFSVFKPEKVAQNTPFPLMLRLVEVPWGRVEPVRSPLAPLTFVMCWLFCWDISESHGHVFPWKHGGIAFSMTLLFAE